MRTIERTSYNNQADLTVVYLLYNCSCFTVKNNKVFKFQGYDLQKKGPKPKLFPTADS